MTRAVALALALVATATTAAHADSSTETYVSKKDQYLLDKQAPKKGKPGKPPAVGKKPAKVIALFNTWTDEWIVVDAVKPKLPPELANEFLRCHFTNEPTDMEDALIPTVVEAAKHFDVAVVYVVSGFRHPKYNLMLRKKGRQVARDSQHSHGTAIDFWLPGVPVHALHAWAKGKQMGGVGLYQGSGFIHMDTGPIRYWNGE